MKRKPKKLRCWMVRRMKPFPHKWLTLDDPILNGFRYDARMKHTLTPGNFVPDAKPKARRK
jgi:hypothetical protein